MVNAVIKIIYGGYPSALENSVNEFLRTIDVRQIVSIQTDSKNCCCVVTYVDTDSYRDLKLDMLMR